MKRIQISRAEFRRKGGLKNSKLLEVKDLLATPVKTTYYEEKP